MKDEFVFQLEGEQVRVEYDRNWLPNYMIHFSFYGKYTSETGYRSYFITVEDYKDLCYTDFKVCARDIAVQLFNELKIKMPELFERKNQLKLFV